MPGTISRRKLLRSGGQAIVAGGAAAVCAGSSLPAVASSRPKVKGVDYYQKLGVATFINAAGTYTTLTASTMPDEVQAAVALAALHPVNLIELHEAAGQYLDQTSVAYWIDGAARVPWSLPGPRRRLRWARPLALQPATTRTFSAFRPT